MTQQEVSKRCREIKPEKARVRRDQAQRQHQRNLKLQGSMHGSIAAEEVEESAARLQICELNVRLWEVRVSMDMRE